MNNYVVSWDMSLWMYPDNLAVKPLQVAVAADSAEEAYGVAQEEVSLEPGATYLVTVYRKETAYKHIQP